MGAGPTKYKPEDVENLERIYPIENHEVKTRSPMPGEWKINILRGKREDEIKYASFKFVRRRCYDYVSELIECQTRNGQFWGVFNCQEELHLMTECFEKQLDIEMDIRRRDMTKNTEWWWRDYYDENGEIGAQAEWDGSSWVTLLWRRAIKRVMGESDKPKESAKS